MATKKESTGKTRAKAVPAKKAALAKPMLFLFHKRVRIDYRFIR